MRQSRQIAGIHFSWWTSAPCISLHHPSHLADPRPRTRSPTQTHLISLLQSSSVHGPPALGHSRCDPTTVWRIWHVWQASCSRQRPSSCLCHLQVSRWIHPCCPSRWRAQDDLWPMWTPVPWPFDPFHCQRDVADFLPSPTGISDVNMKAGIWTSPQALMNSQSPVVRLIHSQMQAQAGNDQLESYVTLCLWWHTQSMTMRCINRYQFSLVIWSYWWIVPIEGILTHIRWPIPHGAITHDHELY